MSALLRGVREDNKSAVLECFSSSRGWTYISDDPDTGKASAMKVSYADLVRGIEPTGDLYDLFFADDRELKRYAEGEPWKPVGDLTFVPDDSAANPKHANVRVKWRRQGSRLVVDSIFESGS